MSDSDKGCAVMIVLGLLFIAAMIGIATIFYAFGFIVGMITSSVFFVLLAALVVLAIIVAD